MHLYDFTAWLSARQLAADIYRATQAARFSSDASLRLEMRDRATSIMTSLASAYEREDSGTFREMLCAASGAAAELQSLIYLAEDAGLLRTTAARPLHGKVAGLRLEVGAVDRAVARFEQLGVEASTLIG